jgi:hypothetical protein
MTGNVPGMVAPTVNPLVQFLQAAGQFPQEQQQSQEDKLKLQQEQQQVQTQKLLNDQNQQKYNMAQFSTVGKMLRYQAQNDPSALMNPANIQSLIEKAKAAGVDPATFLNPDGSINLNAIPGSGGPGDLSSEDLKDISTMSPAMKNAFYKGVLPQSVLDAPPQPTPGEIEKAQGDFNKLALAFGSGSLSADQFAQQIQDQYANFKAAGIDPDAELARLQSDPGYRSQLAILTQQKVDNLKALGLSRTAQAVKTSAEANQVAPLAGSLINYRNTMGAAATTNAAANVQKAQAATTAADAEVRKAEAAQTQADAATTNAQTNIDKLGVEVNKLTLAQGQFALNAVKTSNAALHSSLKDVTSQVDGIVANITDEQLRDQMLNTKDPATGKSLSDRLHSLQTSVNNSDAALKQLSEKIASGKSVGAERVTGTPGTKVQDNPNGQSNYKVGQTVEASGKQWTVYGYGPKGEIKVRDAQGNTGTLNP